YGTPLWRRGTVMRRAAWPLFQGWSQGRTPFSRSAITRSVTRVYRSARGVAVEVFIVELLSVGVTSRKERAVPPSFTRRGNGNTGVRRRRSWPRGGAGRMERAAVERGRGLRRAATVTRNGRSG